MTKEDKPVIVVAKEKGSYGLTNRVPGERFVVKREEHVSKRWMLDPRNKAHAKEIESLERTYKATMGDRARDVTDEQLEAEMAETGGALPALRAENKRLKAEINRLSGVVQELEIQIADAGEANVETKPAGDAETTDSESNTGANEPTGDAEDGANEVGDGSAGAEEKPARRSSARRRRT